MWKSILGTLLFLGVACFAQAQVIGHSELITPEQFFAEINAEDELTEDSIVIHVDQLENIIEEVNRSKRSLSKKVKIWFVNNSNSGQGNGSYKNPFSTLLAAQQASKAGDIIFVFPGDGTTKGMDQGFIMKDRQRLLGAGIHHKIDFPQKKLVVHAPSTILPRITNTNGSVVVLANSCEVSGMNIVDITNGDGILGGQPNSSNPLGNGPQREGIKNTLIRKNIISVLRRNNNLVLDGAIYLANCKGKLVIKKNYILNVLSATTNENLGRGITLFNANLPISGHVTMDDNIVSNTGSTGIHLAHSSPSGKVKALVSHNTVFNIGQTGPGMLVGATESSSGGILCVDIIKNFCQNVHDGFNLLVGSTGNAHVKAKVIENILARSGVSDTGVTLPGFTGVSFLSSHLCLKLVKNYSEFGYQLNQVSDSVFKLEPSHKNLGLPFTMAGNIQRVAAGKCSCKKPKQQDESRHCHCGESDSR